MLITILITTLVITVVGYLGLLALYTHVDTMDD